MTSVSDPRDRQIAELKAQVAELEEALRGAVWPTRAEEERLRLVFHLTTFEAKILLLLYKSRSLIDARAISDALPERRFERLDPVMSVRTLVTRVRNKLPSGALPRGRPGNGGGYVLSESGFRAVKTALTPHSETEGDPPHLQKPAQATSIPLDNRRGGR